MLMEPFRLRVWSAVCEPSALVVANVTVPRRKDTAPTSEPSPLANTASGALPGPARVSTPAKFWEHAHGSRAGHIQAERPHQPTPMTWKPSPPEPPPEPALDAAGMTAMAWLRAPGSRRQ